MSAMNPIIIVKIGRDKFAVLTSPKKGTSIVAINNGTVLPVEWPDIIEVTDGNPDIGAIEHA